MTRTRLLALALVAVLPVAGVVAHRWHAARTLDAVDPSATTLILGTSVSARWPERAPESYASTYGADVQNLAKPGLRLRHIEAALPLETRATRIVLDAGGPDVRHETSPLDTALGISRIVGTLRETTEAHVYVVAMLPDRDPVIDAAIEDANAWTEALVTGWPGVTFVPVHVGPDGMLPDGKHPNTRGYDALAVQIGDALEDRRVLMVSR